MAGPLWIDTLLASAERRAATELRLRTGHCPMMYVGTDMVAIRSDVLTANEVQSVFQQIAPSQSHQELNDSGISRFAFDFGQFHCFVRATCKDAEFDLVIRPRRRDA